MRLKTTKTAGRGAFTLIELLVVISIIVLLVSLTTAAVLKVLIQGPQVTTRTEIEQLDNAIAAFQAKFNIKDSFPSRIVLCENYLDYYNQRDQTKGFVSTLHSDSVVFLQRMFRRIDINAWSTTGIDWNGNGKIDTPNNANNNLILEGDQCLVFFLGGIPAINPNSCTGFSTNPRNPADSSPNVDRIPPFYEFKANRLKSIARKQGGVNGYFSYMDGYGKAPYAYFSSYKSANGYNRYFATLQVSDCDKLDVWPYATNSNLPLRYQKPDTYQIISAGNDGQFGAGANLKTPAQALIWPGTLTQQAKDDQANFAPGILEAGQ